MSVTDIFKSVRI